MNTKEIDVSEDLLWPDDDGAEAAPETGSMDAKSLESVVSSYLPGFNLRGLLTFLPDPKLKAELTALVKAALGQDVTTDAGLVYADTALCEIEKKVKAIEECFDGTEANPGPTRLAGALHRRLTGLRADFIKDAVEAIKALGRKIGEERTRRERVAAEIKRADQERADRELRESMMQVVEQAEQSGMAEEVVEEIRQQAAVAKAPPVQTPAATPKLSTGMRELWRARFRGCEFEPFNPDVTEMTPEQQAQFRSICARVGSGEIKELRVVSLNWSYLNSRAGSDKATFDLCPELEAFDKGAPTRSRKR